MSYNEDVCSLHTVASLRLSKGKVMSANSIMESRLNTVLYISRMFSEIYGSGSYGKFMISSLDARRFQISSSKIHPNPLPVPPQRE